MFRLTNFLVRVIVVLGLVAFLTQSATAATVTYLGVDTTTTDGWRTTDVSKSATFDPNGDNAYGSDGYYMSHGVAPYGTGGFTLDALLPSYVSSVVPSPAPVFTYNSSSFFAKMDDPAQPIGPAPVSDLFSTGVWAVAGTADTKFFEVTLQDTATFLAGVIWNVDLTGWRTNQIKIIGPGGVSDQVTGLVAAVPVIDTSYAFFQLSGNAGDTFEVWMQQDDVSVGPGTSGLLFEEVPEPSVTVMLISGLVGLLAYAWRKRR